MPCLYVLLNLFSEQPMLIAIPVQGSKASKLQPGLGIAFGVELYYLEPIRSHKYHEGDVVMFCHGA